MARPPGGDSSPLVAPSVGPLDGRDRENAPMDLARAAWLSVALACLLAVVILLIQGYLGYAAVTFTVAVSAAINLR